MFILNDNIILEIDKELKCLNEIYIYCGSISLYLNGIKEIITFNDIDIDFIYKTDAEKWQIPLGFINKKYPTDKLSPISEIPIKYHEIDFYDRKLLISDLDYELKIREYLINNIPNYWYKDKALIRINQIKKYLNK